MTIDPLPVFKEKVEAEIARQFSAYTATLGEADPLYRSLLSNMEAFVLRGGKRLRPYISYLAYKGFDGSLDESLMPVFASLELLHTFLLIHDDIIDQDTVRHGGKNIIGTYKAFFSGLEEHDALRNANNVALLAGDIAQILTNRIILNASIHSHLAQTIFSLYQDITLQVAEGELVDHILSLGAEDASITEERILHMYEKKTATYSFALPIRLGHILAKREELPMRTAIQSFSRAAGIAYQLQDDLLGVFGDSAVTGKADDGDIREGKRTILFVKACQKFEGENLSLFKRLYGKRDASLEEVQHIRELLVSAGIRIDIEQLILMHANEALASLKELGLASEAQSMFEALVHSFTSRTS